MHHPGRIWLKTFVTNKGIHIRITDCEYGEWDGSRTVLSFYPQERKWEGHLFNDPNRYTLTQRQAQAMFDGLFDWLIDWWRK